MKLNTKFLLFGIVVIAASILYTESAKISVTKSNNILRASSEGAKVLKKVKKVKKSNKAVGSDQYTLTIFGDIGQFEYYKSNAKNIISELEVNSSYVNKATCEKLIDGHRTELMVNFEKLLTAIKSKADLKTDEAAILGDSIYVEKKGAGEELQTLRKNNPTMVTLVSPHQLVQDTIIKDSKYNKYSEIDTSAIKDLDPVVAGLREREKRLICGWYYLRNNVFTTFKSPDWLVDNVNFINGNHTYDIDYKFETEFVNKNFLPKSFMVKTSGEIDYLDRKATPLKQEDFSLKPRAVKANTTNLNIQYIDIDPSLLVCSDQFDLFPTKTCDSFEEFAICYSERQANKNMPILDDPKDKETCQIHKDYLDKTITLLNSVAKEQVDWRIARMHQPIFNVEYDYAGMKYNKKLMESFKLAHIHVWFVSHFHNAQFTASLYETDNYKYKPQSNPMKDGKPQKFKKWSWARGSIKVGEQNPVAFTDLTDFLIDKNGPSNPDYKFTRGPTGDLNANYNYISWVDRSAKALVTSGPKSGSVKVASCNEEFIFQFLTGNSGRVLDPLFNDRFSDLMLIFGQAYTGQHGYTRFRFYKNDKSNNCLEGTYKILDSKNTLVDVYKQEVCQTDCQKDNRLASLLKENFKQTDQNNLKTNVLVNHLLNTLDPYGSDVDDIPI